MQLTAKMMWYFVRNVCLIGCFELDQSRELQLVCALQFQERTV